MISVSNAAPNSVDRVQLAKDSDVAIRRTEQLGHAPRNTELHLTANDPANDNTVVSQNPDLAAAYL